MGFTTLAAATATAATALPKVFESRAYRQESRNLAAAADQQERLSNAQAEVMINTALRNARAEARNANEQMSHARADAAASNLADEGSVAVRETDLATRLQDDINLRTQTALQEANTTRDQGAYNAWNTRLASQRAKSAARSSLISGIGSLVGGLGASLGAGLVSSRAGSNNSAGRA
ncbi:MAG: hypothetical protein J1E42_04785 [Akkermansiaceae bacterium]|nr:hypothetical protein [Akkermansiaceae bacterium]